MFSCRFEGKQQVAENSCDSCRFVPLQQDVVRTCEDENSVAASGVLPSHVMAREDAAILADLLGAEAGAVGGVGSGRFKA